MTVARASALAAAPAGAGAGAMARREICQARLPLRPWAEERTRRLPGLNPVAPGAWLTVDEAYARQMAYREELLAEKGDAVVRLSPEARPAARELLATVLDEIAGLPGFVRSGSVMTCPDGRVIEIDPADPLATCGRLVQEDLVLMQRPEGADEHLLTGAVLCFPASWTLEQKFMRPLRRIHAPVEAYDENIARRVQRLFDGIRVGAPIWRANYLVYADPDLHQPRREDDRRVAGSDGPHWLRVERQALRRLADTGAVVFSIHTYVLPMAALTDEDRAALSLAERA